MVTVVCGYSPEERLPALLFLFFLLTGDVPVFYSKDEMEKNKQRAGWLLGLGFLGVVLVVVLVATVKSQVYLSADAKSTAFLPPGCFYRMNCPYKQAGKMVMFACDPIRVCPTRASTPSPTWQPIPTVVSSCMWCGSDCVPYDPDPNKICNMALPPNGYECVASPNFRLGLSEPSVICQAQPIPSIVVEPMVSPEPTSVIVGRKTCGMRCGSSAECVSGLICLSPEPECLFSEPACAINPPPVCATSVDRNSSQGYACLFRL